MRSHFTKAHNRPSPWWPVKKDAERYGHWWKHQRKRALDRDGHECQNCEAKTRARFGEDPHVRHIRLFESFSAEGFPTISTISQLCVFHITVCSNALSNQYGGRFFNPMHSTPQKYSDFTVYHVDTR
jgi:hypothetical protein